VKKNPFINLCISSFISSNIIGLPIIAKAQSFNNSQPIITAQNINQLTEENLTAIMKTIEKAEKEKNLQPILDYLSPYVISTVTVESDNTTIITSLQGKKSHENFLKNSFATLKNETDINSYSNIKITEDGQMASVTRVQGTDVVTEDGKKYLSVSTDKIHFALIDNEPKIINVEVKGWLQERP